MNSLLYSAPLLRILTPFIVGILASRLFLYTHLSSGLWAASLLGAAAATAVACTLRLDYRNRWMGGAAIGVLAFALGLGMACLRWQKSCATWPEEEAVYQARLLTDAERRTRSLSCEAQIIGCYSPTEHKDEALRLNPLSRKILLYLNPANPDTALLTRGRILRLSMRPEPPKNYGNPEEFDYRFFLTVRGFSATAYAFRWEATPVCLKSTSIKDRALDLRDQLLAQYRRYGYEKAEDYGLLAALTLGDKESLTREQQDRYSNAGIGHILVVSGLHVGLVFAIVRGLLSLLFPFHFYYTKQIIALLAVWGFTLICGLAPPVLRSSIGLSMFVLANLGGYGHKPMNTLVIAAFALLVWNPLWLFDVGFQLSFCAVAGILLWNDWIFSLLRSRFRWLNTLARATAVCLSAQLGIFPLLACYFSSFPTWFLLANLPAVFLCQFIIGAGALLLLVGSCGTLVEKCCRFLLDHLLEALERLVAFTNSLPYATLDHLHVPWWEGCVIALFILILMHTLQAVAAHRRCRILPLVAASLALTACETVKTIAFHPPRQGLYFYATPSAPAVQGFAQGQPSMLWTDSTASGYSFLRKQLQTYWDKIRLPQGQPYTAQCDAAHSLVHWQGRTLCRLGDNRQAQITPGKPLAIDYLWITRGYSLPLARLPQELHYQTVVLDTSLAPTVRKRLADECRKRGTTCVDLKEEGAKLFDFSVANAK